MSGLECGLVRSKDCGQYLQDAMLSQGEPRDADISFDTTASFVRFHWHSTGFLHRPTSATVQMLKLHTVCWLSQPWRKITEKTTVIVNTWLSYSA